MTSTKNPTSFRGGSVKYAIKIQLVEIRPMTLIGRRQFSPHLRRNLYPYTFHAQKSLGEIPTNKINTKKKIADFIWENAGPGVWDFRGVCPNKHARKGYSMKTIVRIELRPGENEYKYNIIQWKPMRLTRYKKILGWGDKSVY